MTSNPNELELSPVDRTSFPNMEIEVALGDISMSNLMPSTDAPNSVAPAGVLTNLPFSPALLEILKDDLAHVLKNIPKGWDAGARLLALARPIVEAVAISCDGFINDKVREPGQRGPIPDSRISLLTIELFAHLWFLGSYKNACEFIGNNSNWMKALRLRRKPNDTTLCHIRSELGEAFFKQFFMQITKLLIAFGLLAADTELVVDSAPVHANMNFARANTMLTLNEAQLEALFKTLDLTLVKDVLTARGVKITGKRKYPIDALIRVIVLECVGGFLSRSQTLKYLKKNDPMATIVGFDPQVIAPDSIMTTFLKTAPSPIEILRLLHPQLVMFFHLEASVDQDDPLFFLAYCGKVSRAPTMMPGLVIARRKSWHF